MNNRSKHKKNLATSGDDFDAGCNRTTKKARESHDHNWKYLEKEFTCLTSHDTKLPFRKSSRTCLQPHHSSVIEHAQETHKKDFKSSSVSETLNFPKKKPGLTDDLKRAELELALAMCCHCPTSAIDHLGEVIKQNGKGSTLEHLRFHRTKCAALISSVLSPSLQDDVIADIKGKKFSLMLDETTDVTAEKFLAICTRYFSEKSGEIVTAFLALYSVIHATGEELFQILIHCLSKHGMRLSDCVGIACDGATEMVGEQNSVWSRIKEEFPNCILNKCSCHSLALCVQKAFETLPSCLGYLLTEIPGWFSSSTLRRHAYKELFEDMKEHEVDAQSDKKSCHMPFSNLSGTRWLVRGRVVEKFLEHWNKLKAYFKLATQEGTQEVRFKARLIHDMLCDVANYLYFIFLSPVVLEFEEISAFFQSSNIDPDKMFKKLDMLHQKMKPRIFNKQGDFGAEFVEELRRCMHQESNLNEASVQELKKRCQNFLSHLLKEVEKLLPANQAIFQGLSALHPSQVLSQTERRSVSQLPFHHLIEENLDVIKLQYKQIVTRLWSEEAVFDGELPEDSATFWVGIFKYENSKRVKPYKELALYALACLSYPLSNAVVERVFSEFTCVKTEYKNKMSLETLNAIVRIRTTLASRKMYCLKSIVTDDMLSRYRSDIYYAQGYN